MRAFKVRLQPKDPDPYPDFVIAEVSDSGVKFHKLSSGQHLEVELQKIAEITPSPEERLTRIRLHGYVSWEADNRAWRFAPSVLGRPVIRGSA